MTLSALCFNFINGRFHDRFQPLVESSIINTPVVFDAAAEPGVFVADIDMGKVAEARSKVPSLTHDRSLSPVIVAETGESENAAGGVA